MFLVGIPLILFIAGILYSLDTTTSESRQMASVAKYQITVGMSDYYANSYTQTNGILSFHDVLRDIDENFIGKSFSIKNNN